MRSKAVKRANSKVLKDANEFLGLVSSLGKIYRKIRDIPLVKLNKDQVIFFESIPPLIELAMPVVVEVTKVIKDLDDVPSSAPAHKRRALGWDLDDLLFERVDMVKTLIETIFGAAVIFPLKDKAADNSDGEVTEDKTLVPLPSTEVTEGVVCETEVDLDDEKEVVTDAN